MPPSACKALNNQSKQLWHVSNLYKINKQEEFAQLLCKNSFANSFSQIRELKPLSVELIIKFSNYLKTGKNEIISLVVHFMAVL